MVNIIFLRCLGILFVFTNVHGLVITTECTAKFESDTILLVQWKTNNYTGMNFSITFKVKNSENVTTEMRLIDFNQPTDYETRLNVTRMPASEYTVVVIPINPNSTDYIVPGLAQVYTEPYKPEINALFNCFTDVCKFSVKMDNSIENTSLYVSETKSSSDDPTEIVRFYAGNSVLMRKAFNETVKFDINIDTHCNKELLLIGVNTFHDMYAFDEKFYTIPQCKPGHSIIIISILTAILVIVIFILIGVFVYCKYYNREKTTSNGEHIPLRRKLSSTEKFTSLKFLKRMNGLGRVLNKDDLHILLTEQPHVQKILTDEYIEIPDKFHELVGGHQGAKDRYTNILPYKNNRVKIYSNPSYDYINASYIKGFSGEEKYIATQGPLRTSVEDFWGMVWDKNVEKIVMLTNFKEHGQIKCDEYWIEGSSKHTRNMMIVHQHTRASLDYKIRDFKITKGNNSKEVTHYQFTSWMDNLVPHEMHSLIKFIRIIRESITMRSPPIVVHCSAGIGRTGVFILADYLLDMYKEKNIIDVPISLADIRGCRMNMVRNEVQYIFTYCLLNEFLKEKTTEIKLDSLIESIQVFTQDINLEQDIQNIHERDYLLEVLYTRAVHFGWENNKSKHRTLLPPKNCAGFISLPRYPVNDDESYYTNAVKVPNQKQTKMYVSAMQPLPNTIKDFWRLISETGARVVLSLHEVNTDKSSVLFWPMYENAEYEPSPALRLKFVSHEEFDGFTVVKLNLHNISGDSEFGSERIIHLLHFNSWKKTSLPHVHKFINYFKQYMQISMDNDVETTVIACSDGLTGCGLFLTLLYVMEKISHENIFDLCGRVSTLRYYLDGILNEPKEFKYIYKCIQYLYESENHSLTNFYT